jgi:hypothetical protein
MENLKEEDLQFLENSVAQQLLSISKDVKLSDDKTWKSVFTNREILKSSDFLITCKNRTEPPSSNVPERIYSSLKYEFQVSCKPHQILLETFPFLVCKIYCVDSTGQEVVKHGDQVIQGTLECVLNNNGQKDPSIFSGKLKVQFHGVTYHRDKEEYRFLLCIFSSKDLLVPLAKMHSDRFRVYSRKPDKKPEDFDITQMIHTYKKLSKVEKERANEMIVEKFEAIQ